MKKVECEANTDQYDHVDNILDLQCGYSTFSRMHTIRLKIEKLHYVARRGIYPVMYVQCTKLRLYAYYSKRYSTRLNISKFNFEPGTEWSNLYVVRYC